jgi:hypothetical protein
MRKLIALALVLTPFSAMAGSLSGTVTEMGTDHITVQTRNGDLVSVDATKAIASNRFVKMTVGTKVLATGERVGTDKFTAEAIQRAKPSATTWPEDK